ncbi:MAG: hypothetical protein QGH25_05480 [Candidatus Latescibacteria bacterium]|jgi:hypothetical protein|nr:hypothetical protein [Candidatus Latescibacterota bacterium]
MHEFTEEECRAFQVDGYFFRSTLFDAAEADALSGRIEDLMSLIETANAVTTPHQEMILKRVCGAEASSGSAALNSLTRCHRLQRPRARATPNACKLRTTEIGARAMPISAAGLFPVA